MGSYIGRSEAERAEMLRATGARSIDYLLRAVPSDLRDKAGIDLPEGLSELEVLRRLGALSTSNRASGGTVCFAGAGVYDHFVPSAVRHTLLRSEFYTCYTPYQAEVSQGTLQAIFEFQSLMCRLTKMDVCNASMYDAGTALAEAVLLAVGARDKRKVLLSESVNPHYREIVRTYCATAGVKIAEVPVTDGATDAAKLDSMLDGETACFVHQQPNFFGVMEDTAQFARLRASKPFLLISCVDPVSLALLEPPGAYGADVVVGEGQGLGNAMNFGGPLLGFFAARSEYVRRLPGRIVGMTTDVNGKRGFVLTLQTREQHIRRAKATSNICTNEALVALAATVYLSLVGGRGLKEIATQCLSRSHYAARALGSLDGFSLPYERPFFKEFLLRCPVSAEALSAELLSKGIVPGVPLSRFDTHGSKLLLVAVTEKRTKDEIDALATALREAAGKLR
ncbi:MAG: aminomethyl-transferring glycine dehydrogenase subunit GcvPA [Candidatus Eisenbacteria bacterium]